jgi:hypothetical protein
MGKEETKIVALEHIQRRIVSIRHENVMLDRDLAEIYGVETKQLKRAVRRNIRRFPPDFMFELTQEEHDVLRRQFGTIKKVNIRNTFLWLSPNRVLPCCHPFLIAEGQ